MFDHQSGCFYHQFFLTNCFLVSYILSCELWLYLVCYEDFFSSDFAQFYDDRGLLLDFSGNGSRSYMCITQLAF